MPDRIPGLTIMRTDSSTCYASPEPAEIDSTFGDTDPRAPISMTPPDVDGDISDDPIPPLEVHADVETLEETLTDAAESIADAFTADASAELRSRAKSWAVERDFDDNAVTKTPITEQAALAVLLRATLYDSTHDGEFPFENAEEAFRAAASNTTNSAPGWCVLDDVAWLAADAALAPVIRARHTLQESTCPSEDLGRLYAAMVPSNDRQTLSQFRAPRWAGRAMRVWAGGDGDTVLDAGIGAGALSTPLHPSWQVCDEPAEVIGIDRSPLSVLLGTTALVLTNQPRTVLRGDYLDTEADDLPVSVDGMVCNPPYAHTHLLPEPEKTQWNDQAEAEAGADISKLSPLYVYFMIHAAEFLDDGDRAAFLVPQAFLGTQYGVALKRFLKQNFDINALIRVNPDGGSLFADANTAAVFVLLEADSDPAPESETRFVTVDDRDFTALRAAMRSTATGVTDWGEVTTVAQAALNPALNWQAQFDPVGIDTSHLPSLSTLGSVHVAPPAGEAGAFCLTAGVVDQYGISTRHLSRVARHPEDVSGYEIREADWVAAHEDGAEVWLIDPDDLPVLPASNETFIEQFDDGTLTGDTDDTRQDNLLRYLRDSSREYDLSNNSCTERQHWFRSPRHDPAPILLTNASQDQLRFIVNEAALRVVNNFYEVELALTGAERNAVLAYLNSTVMGDVLRRYGRIRSGGMMKISVTAAEQLPVIDPSNLPGNLVQDLADAFDSLRGTARNSDSHDQIIDTIDALVQRAIKQTRPD